MNGIFNPAIIVNISSLETSMAENQNNRIGVIEAITSPLGLFALALLIIESTIGVVLTTSKIPPEQIIYGLLIGSFLFLFTVSIVTYLTIYYPKHLIYDKDSHERETLHNMQTVYSRNEEDKEIIRNFWKKDGVINSVNEGIIENWMADHDLKGIAITYFLRSDEYDEQRKNLVQYLRSNNLI